MVVPLLVPFSKCNSVHSPQHGPKYLVMKHSITLACNADFIYLKLNVAVPQVRLGITYYGAADAVSVALRIDSN